MHSGISALVPEFLQKRWQSTKLGETKNLVNLGFGWHIPELLVHIPQNAEAGGAIFPEGVSVETGNEKSVFSSSGVFTWHSHIEEPCQFSLQDWCSFIQSVSAWSLLITPRHYRVYTKDDDLLIYECKKYISGYSRQRPSAELMGRRLKKFTLKKMPVSIGFRQDDQWDTALGRATGINIGPKYSL
jgi:hypothetical protein